MRVFLDTNIVLDVLLNRPAFIADSEAVIQGCEQIQAEMFLAWHSLATAYYLLRRGRTEQDTMVEVDKILSWVRIANASDHYARHARGLGFSDFEDALQAAAAESCRADCIVTRNTSDFRQSKVRAVSPQVFLEQFIQPPLPQKPTT